MGVLSGDKSALTSVLSLVSSELIERTFEEGMALVEETARYLDGPGREESKTLPRKVALAYAGESMRLTTRLMQVVSWLMVQRAVREEEMTPEEAASDKYRLGSREVCQGNAMMAADLLPETLVGLMARSRRLYDRVQRLDDMLYCGEAEAPGETPPLADSFSAIEAAFDLNRKF